MNYSNDLIYGENASLLTKPQAPVGLTAQANSSSLLYLSWIKGTGANNTYIERYNSSNWGRGTGTEVYNDTGMAYEDTGLTEITTYYYQAWSYSTWGSLHQWSDTNTSGINTTECSPPTVVTNASTGIEETNSTLRGYLQHHGGENCTVRFEYGTNTTYGTNTSNQTKTTGDIFNANISNLTKGQLYHFHAYANNSADSSTGSDKIFLTKPGDSANLTATAVSSSQINLAWTKGAGANNTHIRRKTGSYPTNVTDGTQVYNGTGTSSSNTGLSASTTYYYRVWSYASWDSLNQWSDSYLSINCVTESEGGGGGPSHPPSSSPITSDTEEEESLTTTDQIKNLYGIELNESFYANDTNEDGINDVFIDPNGILNDERFVYMNGNASFLISVNGDSDKLFIWDTEADTVIEVTHGVGTIIDTRIDAKNNTITVIVNINKNNWTYMEVIDPYPNYLNLTIKTSGGRVISSDMIWRENGKIYFLDDPDVEYQLIYIYEAEGFLFDVLLELTADSIFESENIEALITLINVGESGLVNATINYTLYNEEEIIWSEEENISILGQLAFNKTIYTTGLNSGDYIFEVVHHYGDGQTASAQATFTVKARSSEGMPLWVIVGFIVTIAAIILFLFWFFKMRGSSTRDEDYDMNHVIDEIDDIDKIRNKVDKKIAESEERMGNLKNI